MDCGLGIRPFYADEDTGESHALIMIIVKYMFCVYLYDALIVAT